MSNTQFEELRSIFLKHDPAGINPLENNLIDEYDSEIELFLENVDSMTKNNNGVEELLDYVFEEMFGSYVVVLKKEFVQDVATKVL